MKTAKEIAESNGINFNTVRGRIMKAGLKPIAVKYRCRFYSEEQERQIVNRGKK